MQITQWQILSFAVACRKVRRFANQNRLDRTSLSEALFLMNSCLQCRQNIINVTSHMTKRPRDVFRASAPIGGLNTRLQLKPGLLWHRPKINDFDTHELKCRRQPKKTSISNASKKRTMCTAPKCLAWSSQLPTHKPPNEELYERQYGVPIDVDPIAWEESMCDEGEESRGKGTLIMSESWPCWNTTYPWTRV